MIEYLHNNVKKINLFVYLLLPLGMVMSYLLTLQQEGALVADRVQAIGREKKADVFQLESHPPLKLKFSFPLFNPTQYLAIQEGDVIEYRKTAKEEVTYIKNLRNGHELSTFFFSVNSFLLVVYLFCFLLLYLNMSAFSDIYRFRLIVKETNKKEDLIDKLNKYSKIQAIPIFLSIMAIFYLTVKGIRRLQPMLEDFPVYKYIIMLLPLFIPLFMLTVYCYSERKTNKLY